MVTWVGPALRSELAFSCELFAIDEMLKVAPEHVKYNDQVIPPLRAPEIDP
jgi:hypothetical protein